MGKSRVWYIKAAVFLVGLVPLFGMIARFITDPPPDPFEFGAELTGKTALRLLVLTLAVTPLRLITGYRKFGPYRRTLGVLCFTYALVHIFGYMYLEAGFDPAFVIADITERRYITVGFLAYVLMVPLAVTSNNASVKWLGARWRKLHRLVYPVSILACIHFLWINRGEDMGEPLTYLAIVLALLGVRVFHKIRATHKRATA